MPSDASTSIERQSTRYIRVSRLYVVQRGFEFASLLRRMKNQRSARALGVPAVPPCYGEIRLGNVCRGVFSCVTNQKSTRDVYMIFDKVRIYSIYEYWSQWCRRGSVTAPTLPEKMVPARYCRYGVNSTWYIPTSTWYLVPGTRYW